jgi:hypothetical protein
MRSRAPLQGDGGHHEQARPGCMRQLRTAHPNPTLDGPVWEGSVPATAASQIAFPFTRALCPHMQSLELATRQFARRDRHASQRKTKNYVCPYPGGMPRWKQERANPQRSERLKARKTHTNQIFWNAKTSSTPLMPQTTSSQINKNNPEPYQNTALGQFEPRHTEGKVCGVTFLLGATRTRKSYSHAPTIPSSHVISSALRQWRRQSR